VGGAWLFPGRFLLGWYRCLQSFLNQSTYRFRARADPIPESEIFDPGEKHVTMSHERDNRKCLEIPDPATDGRPTHGPGRSPGFFHEGGKYEREGMVKGYTGTAGASRLKRQRWIEAHEVVLEKCDLLRDQGIDVEAILKEAIAERGAGWIDNRKSMTGN